VLLSGKEVSAYVRKNIAQKSEEFFNLSGHRPTLAVVLVGDDPASATYVASKGRACDELFFIHQDYKLDNLTDEETLIKLIERLNADTNVDAILVQLPLPKHLDERKILNMIDSSKDVDGLGTINLGALITEEELFVPCTPNGILELFKYYNIELSGKNVVIVGRSNIVGKPLAALLVQKGKDATVTVCHSKTKNLAQITKEADILIAAIGRAHFITKEMVKEGAVVIDVGINRIKSDKTKSGFRLVGDVDFDSVKEKCSAITPVPGGVGPMTIAMLMENTLKAAKKHFENRR
jgi:methylenetetrahydrofolate dehydrogenase (NADP+)/methenyltetrahydrofolate cyclohydrolase